MNIGKNVGTLEVSPAFEPITKIILNKGVDSNGVMQSVVAGTDTGRTMEADCPWATQAIANALLTQLGGFVYQPYAAADALVDPACELGDNVKIDGTKSYLFAIDPTFDALYTADISAPQEEEIDHEYPYEPKENREIVRKTATITAELRVAVDSISAEVAGMYAPAWASGTSYYKGSAVKITAQDGTVTYYECILAHTADLATKPPNATYWTVISAPNVSNMVKVGLDGLVLSASAGTNRSTVTITANGIEVDSAVVTFSSIVADSIVANASITSPVITGGTISGTKIQSTSTFQGVTYGTFINDGNIDLKWGNTIYGRITLGDALGETKFRTFNFIDLTLEASGFLKLKSGTGANSGFAGLILDSSMYGTLAQRPAAGTAGRIFFVRA